MLTAVLNMLALSHCFTSCGSWPKFVSQRYSGWVAHKFMNVLITNLCYFGKGKAILLQAWTGPEGSMRLRLPEFLDSWHMKVVRLLALCTGHLYPAGNIRGTHFC
jgi:hypothetical protein